jgi:hypothetical protein
MPSFPRKRESILILLLAKKAKMDSCFRGNDDKEERRSQYWLRSRKLDTFTS